MVVSSSSWGYPEPSSILDWDFPLQTIQLWGYPHGYGTPHMFVGTSPTEPLELDGSYSRHGQGAARGLGEVGPMNGCKLQALLSHFNPSWPISTHLDSWPISTHFEPFQPIFKQTLTDFNFLTHFISTFQWPAQNWKATLLLWLHTSRQDAILLGATICKINIRSIVLYK